MQACTLTCTSPCTYYKDKANVKSIPLTINPEPSLSIQTSFYKEINNRQVSSLPRTKQPDNFLSTIFENSERFQSFPVVPSVCWFKTVNILANNLIGTRRPCGNRFCTDDTDAFKYPHNGGNFHNFLQLICYFVVY